MIRAFFLSILFCSQAFSYCYFVSCAPSVIVNSAIIVANFEKDFLKIKTQLNEVENLYKTYIQVLGSNNLGYEENAKLKAEYLLILKDIKETQQKILQLEEKQKIEGK